MFGCGRVGRKGEGFSYGDRVCGYDMRVEMILSGVFFFMGLFFYDFFFFSEFIFILVLLFIYFFYR